MLEHFWQAFALAAAPYVVALCFAALLRGTSESLANQLQRAERRRAGDGDDADYWPPYSRAWFASVLWFLIVTPLLSALLGVLD